MVYHVSACLMATSLFGYANVTWCRKGVQQKMLAEKQARLDVARTKPWRLSKQSWIIDSVLTELLSGQELLYALVFSLTVCTAASQLHDSDLPSDCLCVNDATSPFLLVFSDYHRLSSAGTLVHARYIQTARKHAGQSLWLTVLFRYRSYMHQPIVACLGGNAYHKC